MAKIPTTKPNKTTIGAKVSLRKSKISSVPTIKAKPIKTMATLAIIKV
jgi:hypothetical protein